jgi:hypothetical protein
MKTCNLQHETSRLNPKDVDNRKETYIHTLQPKQIHIYICTYNAKKGQLEFKKLKKKKYQETSTWLELEIEGNCEYFF